MKILLIESTLKSGISVFALEQNETRPTAPLNKKNPSKKANSQILCLPLQYVRYYLFEF